MPLLLEPSLYALLQKCSTLGTAALSQPHVGWEAAAVAAALHTWPPVKPLAACTSGLHPAVLPSSSCESLRHKIHSGAPLT